MADSESAKSSFWTTLPGILTGVAAVLTAGATVVALVLSGGNGNGGAAVSPAGGNGGGTPPVEDEVTLAEWASAANDICRDGYDDVIALGIPDDPVARFQAIPQSSAIVTRINQGLTALERPPQYEEEIARVLELGSRSNVAFRHAYAASAAGDTVSGQSFLDEASALAPQLGQLYSELGANVCAEG